MAITGFATEAGTARYRARQTACHPGHFRRLQDLCVSSVGLGTYLGDPDERTDHLYAQAIEAALLSGCNLIDTAINYRCQRSERTIGETLERLIGQGAIRRDELVLCTKGGYLPFDGAVPHEPERYVRDTFLAPGVIQDDELVAGYHCLAPRYLAHQMSRSLHNLHVETIDVYYLHNPEQQLEERSRETFLARVEAACAFLEDQVQQGTIRLYGTATWNGYRANPHDPTYLSLHELVEVARRVGGERHHFRVIQVPYNLAMPEALGFKNQLVDGESLSLLEAAQRLGVSVVVSASLLQSRLATLPDALGHLIPHLATDAQRAIQFIRSSPGVTTALVGMKRNVHVEENLALANVAPMPREQIEQLFVKARR